MKAHDAGLKGTLTDNGDGTATFVMDTLNAGDKVSIGGKSYTIGSDDAEVDKWFKDNAADVKAAAGGKITINGTEYKYYSAIAKDDVNDKGAVEEGFYATQPSAPDGKGNTVKADFANIDALKTAVKKGATAQNGAKSITGMNDVDTNGISDTDATVISKTKAYQLASKELLTANQIGDTEGNATVGKDKNYTSFDGTDGDGTFYIKTGQAKVANSLAFSLHVGADADMTNKIQVNIDAMDSASLGIKGLNVKDDSGNAATYAVDAISDAISKVSSQRSSLGAVQNRLEHTINNLDNVVENTTTAESRIRDTDMAKEMVNYSKNNILAQAGQSMLAQANQSNQGVLSLLQ